MWDFEEAVLFLLNILTEGKQISPPSGDVQTKYQFETSSSNILTFSLDEKNDRHTETRGI